MGFGPSQTDTPYPLPICKETKIHLSCFFWILDYFLEKWKFAFCGLVSRWFTEVPPSSVAYVRLSTHLRAIPTPLSLICFKWRKLGRNFKLVVLRLQYVKTSRQNAGMNEVKTLISASFFANWLSTKKTNSTTDNDVLANHHPVNVPIISKILQS